MDQAVPPSRRVTFGFSLSVVCVVFGFWLRYRAISEVSEATGNFDFSRIIGNATSMARNAEAGLFLILIGGLVFVMTFWRWLHLP